MAELNRIQSGPWGLSADQREALVRRMADAIVCPHSDHHQQGDSAAVWQARAALAEVEGSVQVDAWVDALDRALANGQAAQDNVLSFDAHRIGSYVLAGLIGYLKDPADSDYQRGFLGALLTIYREGLGKGVGDDRLLLLDGQCEAR